MAKSMRDRVIAALQARGSTIVVNRRVLSTGRYIVAVEDEPGHDYPTVRPHYE